MIKFDNVTKKYGENTALKDLNLDIENGEILGLIGHNGAGKSTTIKALVGVIEQTAGEIYIDNLNIRENPVAAKEQIGYVSDSPDLFLRMIANDYWSFIARAYGLNDKERDGRLERLVKLFSLEDDRFSTIESFSHGMRQKVFLIGALLPDPNIWVLDEPMTGLDPQAAFDLKQLMRKHADEGNVVIFSTHVLEVAEQICDKIAILKKGVLIYHGTIQNLKRTHPEMSLESIYLGMAGREEDGSKA